MSSYKRERGENDTLCVPFFVVPLGQFGGLFVITVFRIVTMITINDYSLKNRYLKVVSLILDKS